ncbi:MAG: hypothetical protein MJ003_03740 [Paludibacteraceae bacterium]|nr:hypothetical protein [Paludibacteraceae bacterium]
MKEYIVEISPNGCLICGEPLDCEKTGADLLTELYGKLVGDYPKFYKMDSMSRLAFIASELVLRQEGKPRFTPNETRKIILANNRASLHTDLKYNATINKKDYYPSPSLFVYTLPNIATGEIAIRNKYYGESCFLVLENEEHFIKVLKTIPLESDALVGWVEYNNDTDYKCIMWIEKP